MALKGGISPGFIQSLLHREMPRGGDSSSLMAYGDRRRAVAARKKQEQAAETAKADAAFKELMGAFESADPNRIAKATALAQHAGLTIEGLEQAAAASPTAASPTGVAATKAELSPLPPMPGQAVAGGAGLGVVAGGRIPRPMSAGDQKLSGELDAMAAKAMVTPPTAAPAKPAAPTAPPAPGGAFTPPAPPEQPKKQLVTVRDKLGRSVQVDPDAMRASSRQRVGGVFQGLIDNAQSPIEKNAAVKARQISQNLIGTVSPAEADAVGLSFYKDEMERAHKAASLEGKKLFARGGGGKGGPSLGDQRLEFSKQTTGQKLSNEAERIWMGHKDDATKNNNVAATRKSLDSTERAAGGLSSNNRIEQNIGVLETLHPLLGAAMTATEISQAFGGMSLKSRFEDWKARLLGGERPAQVISEIKRGLQKARQIMHSRIHSAGMEAYYSISSAKGVFGDQSEEQGRRGYQAVTGRPFPAKKTEPESGGKGDGEARAKKFF